MKINVHFYKGQGKLLLKALALVGGVVMLPAAAYAATDSANTTINANIGSTISVSTSGTVGINVIPVSGGSQSSASDTVSVSTNNAAGYALTLANGDTDTELENGANSIDAHDGTQADPTELDNNTWGYAVASLGGFDSSYSALNNAANSDTLWAGVPSSASPNTLKTTSSTASGDTTTVWYSVKVDTSKPNGTYSDTVTYTATTNP